MFNLASGVSSHYREKNLTVVFLFKSFVCRKRRYHVKQIALDINSGFFFSGQMVKSRTLHCSLLVYCIFFLQMLRFAHCFVLLIVARPKAG